MADEMQAKIQARIAELEIQKEQASRAYADKDTEINQTTQAMSEQIRGLRNERGNFALGAARCQQAIDELRGLLETGPGGGN